MFVPARLSASLTSARFLPHRARLQRLVPQLVSCYSTPAPPQHPPSHTNPTPDGGKKGPTTLLTPPEPPVEYSRKPREISSLSKNPWVVRAVKAIAPFLGYYSRTTTAIRETRGMYARCGERLEREQEFLYTECALPPTYQTWFQFTLLHVLILTARLRALPPDLAQTYQAELINHFFLDIEHRMRAVLGTKVPERLVKGYMKEMRDQWRGGGVAFDLGIVGTDAALAGMVWRNLFASRGAPLSVAASTEPTNLASPSSKKLVIANDQDAQLVPILYQFVAHARREMVRLEGISDKEVAYGQIGEWGTVSSVRAPKGEGEFDSWQSTGDAIEGGQKKAATA